MRIERGAKLIVLMSIFYGCFAAYMTYDGPYSIALTVPSMLVLISYLHTPTTLPTLIAIGLVGRPLYQPRPDIAMVNDLLLFTFAVSKFDEAKKWFFLMFPLRIQTLFLS